MSDLVTKPRASGSTKIWWLAGLRDAPAMWAALFIAALLVLAALFAPLLAPYDPDAQKLLMRLKPPMGFDGAKQAYPFGTDQLGRDLLSRCLYGLRLTLALAIAGSLISLVLGAIAGLVAGTLRGLAEHVIMGICDVMISLPFTLVALVVIAIAGASTGVMIAVLSLNYWAHYARLIRAQVVALKDMPYIEAARAAGASEMRIALKHIVPNITSPLIVMFTLNLANLILLESALSFLGLGVQPPTATLGSMVGQGRDYMASAPWVVATPALLIMLVSLVVMLLGDALRDYFDVRLRER